ncbi:MAG: ATP-binding protein [Thermodesulfobacteriota bacterium]
MKQRIFISSVQKEFSGERKALRDFLRGDPLLYRFFDVFLFEEAPAKDRRVDELYLKEVKHSSIYIGLFGNEYGVPDKNGLSPTHREFLQATKFRKHRLIFVKGGDDSIRNTKMKALIEEAESQLVRRRFTTTAELIAGIYASLIDYLADKDLLRIGPFDASICEEAGLKDISTKKVKWFLNLARDSRGFPLEAGADIQTVLTHLRLLKKGHPINAAILLFGREPQRFIYSSEVKCAHFHGTQVQKPIPFYQVYKGNLFELVDQAVNFVLSKIDLAVGTRAVSIQAPVAYEIPPEVITEAIVNAIAHRDYTSTASVQVMLFSDRLEVWNPGSLPPALTLKSLLKPHGSYPRNPLIAEPLYLTKYIERMGTGIRDMIERCRTAGLSGPEFKLTDGFVITIRRKPDIAFKTVGGITPQVFRPESRPESQLESRLGSTLAARIFLILKNRDQGKAAMASELGHKTVSGELNKQIKRLQELGLIEMTIPEKPNSRLQKYRVTKKGKEYLEGIKTKRERK